MPATLNVQGFTGHLLALNGTYQAQAQNHGKPTYKKSAEMDGTTQCCVYYWDERDGDALAGWWMAPEVGGEQVWAHAPSRNPTPPTRGWRVPWHTTTPDNRVMMQLNQAGAGGFQNQQQQGANKFSARPNQQQGQVQSAIGGAQTGNAPNHMKRFPQNNAQQQGNAAAEARARAQKEKNLAQVNNIYTTAENAVKKLSGPESKEANFDKMRFISLAKSAVASVHRSIDGHMKTQGLEESAIKTLKEKLQKLDKEVTDAEAVLKAEQKQKLDALKNTYVGELTKLVTEVEKQVEKTKDAAVLFTCEMAEHIKPEEAVEAKEKTDVEAKPATESVKKAKELMFNKDKELKGFPAAEVSAIRESVKPLNARLLASEKELNTVKGQAMAAWRKANVTLQKKKREEEAEIARVERERVANWNKELAGYCFQIDIVSEDFLKAAIDEEVNEDTLKETESKLLGLKNELQKRHDSKDCSPPSKHQVIIFLRKIDGRLNKIKQLLKEQKNKDQDKVRRMAVEIATAARTLQGETSDADFIAEHTAKTNKMDLFKFEKFVKAVGVDVERSASLLFKEACKFVSTETTVLDKDAFILHVVNAYHTVAKPTAITKELAVSSEKVGTLEANSVVQVIEGPTEVEGAIRVKIIRAKKDGTTDEGFATLRSGPTENLVRYSPHYTVMNETVLTDTFDLKGFKVVRRIKADEKFRAIGIPKYNKESDMWRINGVTEQSESVWVTIQGNRGTSLLRNEPLSAIAAAANKEAEIEEFSEEKLNAILVTMVESNRAKLQNFVDESAEAVKAVTEVVEKLAALDGEGKEPSQEEIAEIVKEVDAAFQAQREKNNKGVQAINRLKGNLKDVVSGPFAELKENFAKYLESYNEQGTEIKALLEKRRSLQKSVTQKESERRIAKEKAEIAALSEKLLAELKPEEEEVVALQARLTALEEKSLPQLTDTIAEFQATYATTFEEINSLKTKLEALKKSLTERIPVQVKGALHGAVNEMKKLRSTVTALYTKCENWSLKLKQSNTSFKEKIRVDFSVLLKNHLAEKEMEGEALFKSLAGEAETLSLEKFEEFAKSICPELKSTEELLKASIGNVTELTMEHIVQLSKASYRVLKRAIITDIVDIKTCKKLKAMDPEDIVEVVEKHTICAKTNLVRFKGRATDGTVGYVTLKGNKNTTYVKFQQSCYKVVKETVFTDSFEMKNFKVLRRLKEGDYLRELTLPTLDSKSGLYRMKAQSVADNQIGWVTIKGNAGSTFLVNCEMPEIKKVVEAEKPVEEKEAEEPAAKKAKTE